MRSAGADDPANGLEEKVARSFVLGTRGPSIVSDLLLGDVSTEVLRYARCPVLLVP